MTTQELTPMAVPTRSFPPPPPRTATMTPAMRRGVAAKEKANAERPPAPPKVARPLAPADVIPAWDIRLAGWLDTEVKSITIRGFILRTLVLMDLTPSMRWQRFIAQCTVRHLLSLALRLYPKARSFIFAHRGGRVSTKAYWARRGECESCPKRKRVGYNDYCTGGANGGCGCGTTPVSRLDHKLRLAGYACPEGKFSALTIEGADNGKH